MNFNQVKAALNRIYNPPIRGRFSKKKRIRKKALKHYRNSASYLAYPPSVIAAIAQDITQYFQRVVISQQTLDSESLIVHTVYKRVRDL